MLIPDAQGKDVVETEVVYSPHEVLCSSVVLANSSKGQRIGATGRGGGGGGARGMVPYNGMVLYNVVSKFAKLASLEPVVPI